MYGPELIYSTGGAADITLFSIQKNGIKTSVVWPMSQLIIRVMTSSAPQEVSQDVPASLSQELAWHLSLYTHGYNQKKLLVHSHQQVFFFFRFYLH